MTQQCLKANLGVSWYSQSSHWYPTSDRMVPTSVKRNCSILDGWVQNCVTLVASFVARFQQRLQVGEVHRIVRSQGRLRMHVPPEHISKKVCEQSVEFQVGIVFLLTQEHQGAHCKVSARPECTGQSAGAAAALRTIPFKLHCCTHDHI